MKTTILKYTLFVEGISLLLTLLTKGMSNNIFFALFWASTIVALVSVLSLRIWNIEEWFSFGAITFALVGGVLYAIKALQREVCIVILISILLFMAGSTHIRKLCTKKRRLQRRKRRETPKVIIVDEVVEEKKKTATKRRAKKVANSKKTTAPKKKVAKKKTASKKRTTKKKVSTKKKRAEAVSYNKYKPKLPTTKKSSKKKTAKKKAVKKKTTRKK